MPCRACKEENSNAITVQMKTQLKIWQLKPNGKKKLLVDVDPIISGSIPIERFIGPINYSSSPLLDWAICSDPSLGIINAFCWQCETVGNVAVYILAFFNGQPPTGTLVSWAGYDTDSRYFGGINYTVVARKISTTEGEISFQLSASMVADLTFDWVVVARKTTTSYGIDSASWCDTTYCGCDGCCGVGAGSYPAVYVPLAAVNPGTTTLLNGNQYAIHFNLRWRYPSVI